MSALQQILSVGVVPLFYTPDTHTALQLTAALQQGGLNVVEFTHRGEAAPSVFRALRAAHPHLTLGIGSVTDGQTAQAYVDAGADFVVSPCVVEAVAETLPAHVPYLPGAQTVREVFLALQCGAPLVKLFPGEVLGPAFVKALLGPLPGTPTMVTGGVDATEDSLRTWFDAGARAVGLGSRLVPNLLGLTEDERQARLQRLTAQSADLVRWAHALRQPGP